MDHGRKVPWPLVVDEIRTGIVLILCAIRRNQAIQGWLKASGKVRDEQLYRTFHGNPIRVGSSRYFRR